MKNIVEHIDKVASAIESKGFVKEAEELDIIANTIEKMAFPKMPRNIEEAKDIIMRAVLQFGKDKVKNLIDDILMRHKHGEKFASDLKESDMKLNWALVAGAVLLFLKLFGEPALNKLKADVDKIKEQEIGKYEMIDQINKS